MARIASVSINIAPDEVLPPGRAIVITSDVPIDARSAQGAVRLMQGCRRVELSHRLDRRGRELTLDLPPELLGPFVLVIDELLSEKSTIVMDAVRLPFVVTPISGKVASALRIEHAVRLRFDELDVVRLPPSPFTVGTFVDVLKVASRKDGSASELAFDEQGHVVDTTQLYAQVGRRRDAKYGRIDPTLHALLEKQKEGAVLPIVVWPRLERLPAPYDKPADRRVLEPPAGERKAAAAMQKARASLQAVLRELKISLPRPSERADALPPIRTRAKVSQIRSLARDKAVGVILLDDTSAYTDLGNSIAVARSDRAQLEGYDGSRVNVAVWEDGPKDLTNLSFAARYDSNPPQPSNPGHPRLTSAIVKNVERGLPHGHAPGCQLFSANSKDVDALTWAVRDQGCTVISQSFHRGSEPGAANLQSDDLLKDWLALHWPYPTILQAAGNFWQGDTDNIQPPEDEYVNHKGYNSLAIGNHDDTASAMSGDSVFRNPASRHGDRELPELSANGTAVSANGQTMSGTSFAAPATAGVTALLQQADETLKSWPEGCRAILLAAAGRNVQDGTWWSDVVAGVDGHDGSGALDARAGIQIARQRRFRDAPGTRDGWDVGTLKSKDIGTDGVATFRYHVTVPTFLRLARAKVALAWDGAITSIFGIPLASTLTVDLDLSVLDASGALVASSASFDNSYEVAEFAARPGQTYEIRIRRYSGRDDVWYGVAWTLTSSLPAQIGGQVLTPLG